MTSSVPVISNTASIVVAGAGSRAEKEEKTQTKTKPKRLNSYNMPKLESWLITFLYPPLTHVYGGHWSFSCMPASHMHRPAIVKAGLGDWSTITPQI